MIIDTTEGHCFIDLTFLKEVTKNGTGNEELSDFGNNVLVRSMGAYKIDSDEQVGANRYKLKLVRVKRIIEVRRRKAGPVTYCTIDLDEADELNKRAT